jgi:hypothetical protein
VHDFKVLLPSGSEADFNDENCKVYVKQMPVLSIKIAKKIFQDNREGSPCSKEALSPAPEDMRI